MTEVKVIGKLLVKNVVSTYFTRIGAGDSEPAFDINLPAVALSTHGKYGRGVFPAVVGKARIPISGVVETEPSPASLYPLQKKSKPAKSAASKLAHAARNKKLKAALHKASQIAPRQYLTATDSQFKSGQNVVAGGTSVISNTLIAYTFIRRLAHDLDLDLRIYNMQTQNIVCSADLGYELNTEWLASEGEKQGWRIYFHPEEFIGLTFVTFDDNVAHTGTKIVFVVFNTGNIVATGMKTTDQIEIASHRMHTIIGQFRKGSEPASFSADSTHMRDQSTLQSVKQESSNSCAGGRQGQMVTKMIGVKSGSNSKDNAAKRNFKRISHDVKGMLKCLEEVFSTGEDAECVMADTRWAD